MTKAVSILAFMGSLPHFRGPSWAPWRVLLAAVFALPISEADMTLFRALTARQRPPQHPVGEGWFLLGRRSGKSIIAALVAVYVACFRTYRLAPGERALVALIAPDRRQAAILLRYILGLLQSVPALAALIVRETTDAIELSNGVVLEVKTASFRTARGYTAVLVIVDEGCFLRDEASLNPDTELLAAIRPAMATVPGALFLFFSSPHARRGVGFEAYQRFFGQDEDEVLVANASTEVMNATVSARVIADAYTRDSAIAAAEYGGQFRSDLETFVTLETLELALLDGPLERAPESGQRYVAFVDPSGGSHDSMTIAVAHLERWENAPIAVLDLVLERTPPFSPEQVVADFAERLHDYRISRVIGDRYAGEWPREQFRKHGIAYEPSARSKTEIYRDLLPLLNSGGVGLPEHPVLLRQLVGLERRVIRGGGETIDHGARGHDDVANAVAGALILAIAGASREPVFIL